jgi:2-keto-4-pentenoate hydratase/2-oxohepta-3-ene-1,7-dioic acid hydratase in catechol pathway
MIRSIWAIGRNYAEHARELGHEVPQKTEPIIFLKSGATVVANGRAIHLPTWSQDVHFETEIAVRVALEGTPEAEEKIKVEAFTIAIDLTARDIQTRLKDQKLPWTLAKSFKDSCPLGDWVSATKLGKDEDEIWEHLQNLEFSLTVNGELKQNGFSKDMIFSIQETCNYLHAHFPLQTGDVLLTGTPAGVGPLFRGDQLEAEIKGFLRASWTVL